MPVNSRVVVVTGATHGLGRALALAAAAAGHVVAGCGRDRAALVTLRAELGPRHVVLPADVRRADEIAVLARAVLERAGVPDLLVNNAAVINRPAPLWEVPEEEFASLVDINVSGVHRVLRAFLPAMIERGRGGVVVNLSSGWGRSVSPGVAPYCASKFAVEGMTRALAAELPPGFAAVALNPGVIDTDMLRTAWAEEAASYEDAGRWAARALPFLLRLTARDNGRSLDVPG